jgi:two-component system, NtrC family, sensor kinase
MKIKDYSIKLKLIIFFTFVSIILFVAVGLVFFRSNKIAVNNSKEKEIQTLAQETGNKIERFLFERYGDIQVMEDSPLLKRNDISNNLKIEYLESVRKAYKTYDFISTTNVKGEIEIASGNIGNDTNYKKWISIVLNDKIFVSDFTYLPSEKSYVIYMAAPLKDMNGNIKGAVVERVNFSSIIDIVKNVTFGKTGNAYLANINNSTFLKNSNTKQTINFNGKTTGIYYSINNNINYVSAYSSLTNYDTQKVNWYIIVEQAQSEAFAVSDNLKIYTIMVMIVSVLAIFISALIMSKGITRPFNIMNSNLKTMEQKVIKISNELEKSVIRAKNLESLAEMSAGMAHEIRNPLTSIKGYAQYIQYEIEDKSSLKSDAQVIIDEVDRLNRIVDRFLSFARPKELQLKPTFVNNVVYEVIKVIKKDIEKKQIKFYTKLKETPLAMVDFEQLEQVILNLVLNSIQAMQQGGKLSIHSGYLKDLSMVYISIKDTGVGINEENYDKIFEPFYTTKNKGTGLGLAICARIIENHKGYIEVKSAQGLETVFTIKLPVIGTDERIKV